MQLKVRVPKSLGLKQKIVSKYSYLYHEYRRFYPGRKDYNYRQLRHNIDEVAAIVNSIIESSEVRSSIFIPWLDNGWKEFYFKHWYFAITVEIIDNLPIALVQDAHYEGDHHNDVILSKPYDDEDFLYQC